MCSLAPGPWVTIKANSQIDMAPYIVPNEDDDEEGPNHIYYKSEKLLGVLYRAIDERKIWAENIRRNNAQYDNSSGFWETLVLAVKARVSEYFGDLEWSHRWAQAERIRHA
jgi:hypothetical protein